MGLFRKKTDLEKELGIKTKKGEEICQETLEELSNGKGEDEE